MPDPRSAQVRRLPQRGMITLKGDLSAARLQAALLDAVGLEIPGQREIRLSGDTGLAWMAPDEVLILVPFDTAVTTATRLSAGLAGMSHLVANVSDARALFEVAGTGAREVLAKGAPVDLAPDQFEPGQIRRTRLAQVAAAFWMPAPDVFHVVCFRSVAEYMADWLDLAATDGTLPEHL